MSLSRRGLFSLLSRPLKSPAKAAASSLSGALSGKPPHAGTAPETPAVASVAIIQGRHCIALTSFCSVCVERCPVPGAMRLDHGMPMVVGEVCTGCAVCRDVCPAPTNAVLMLPRRVHPPVKPPGS